MKKKLGAVLDCFLVPYSPVERSFEMLKRIIVYEMEVRRREAKDRSQTGEEKNRGWKDTCQDLSFSLVGR